MEGSNARTYGIGAVCLLAGIVLGFFLKGCSNSEKPNNSKPIVLTDTIRVHDTLSIKEHTKPRDVVRYDTIWLQKDTTNSTTKDTTKEDAEYALVPITQSEYRDTFATDSTRAEVAVLFSGYNARIDSIGINYQATIQPVVYEKKRGWAWCVMPSVQVGYGVAFGNQVITAPYVGVGVSVGFGYTWRK